MPVVSLPYPVVNLPVRQRRLAKDGVVIRDCIVVLLTFDCCSAVDQAHLGGRRWSEDLRLVVATLAHSLSQDVRDFLQSAASLLHRFRLFPAPYDVAIRRQSLVSGASGKNR